MTTTSTPTPRTALAVLFGPDASALDALARRITSDPASLGHALKHLPEATRQAAERQVSAAAAGLLNVDLIALLAEGWRKYQDLVAAARRTVAAPDSVELVQLASHQVTTAQQPYITILVDDQRVATINLGLTVVFDVSALIAEIRGGRLAAVQSGHCDITATLAVEGSDLVTGQTRLDLPGVLTLSHGIPLLPARDYPAATPAATTGGTSGTD